MKRISGKRRKMGEQAWAEYQRERQNAKAYAYQIRNVEKVVEWRQRTKKNLIEYKGSKCEICGFDKPVPACYDFHHIDPNSKEFRIGGKSISIERLKAEVDKCMLLCANCHRELHSKDHASKKERTKKKIRDSQKATVGL